MKPITLSSPDITQLERDAVLEVLSRPQLSLGPELPRFEQALAEKVGTKHAIAVNSGTSALHLCIKSANISDGDEVITTPFSFVASANCILFERAKPVFVDIDPQTYNIDIDRIEEAITPRTKAILPVHVFGRPCNMEKIMEIANRHGLAVIEDSCEALGATIHGRSAGSFGLSGTFAFYPNKQITTGEGGAIVTNDDQVAALARSWRNQGRGESSAWLQHERLGFNYRLSDLNCALGTAQLSRLDEILEKRNLVADTYTELLRSFPEIITPAEPVEGHKTSWFVYVVQLSAEFNRDQRNEILSSLRDKQIGCSDYFSPIHLQPYFQNLFGYKRGDFPVTEDTSDKTIALPFHSLLSKYDIEYVTETLGQVVTKIKKFEAVNC